MSQMQWLCDASLCLCTDCSSANRFLWVSVALKALSRIPKLDCEQGQQYLENLPSDIPTMMLERLDSIDAYYIPYISRALAWLALCGRQLFVEELIDACSIDLSTVDLPMKRISCTAIENLLRDLITVWPPLNTSTEVVQARHHTIVLSHASFKDFLLTQQPPSESTFPKRTKIFNIDKKAATQLIVQTCLAYLFRYNNFQTRKGDHPLRHYAWYSWDRHISLKPSDASPTFDSNDVRRRAWRLYEAIDWLGTERDDLCHNEDGNIEDIQAIKAATTWLSNRDSLPRLKEALNIPFFLGKIDLMYDTGYPTARVDGRHGFGSLGRSIKRPIRLLQILPCLEEKSIIRGTLILTTLEAAPPYTALSYEWGCPQREEYASDRVQRPKDCPGLLVDGLKTDLRSNLIPLLQLLRSRMSGKHNAVWIDSICINQRDDIEKGSQGAMIGEIFAAAREVVIDFNDTKGTAKLGIQYLRHFAAAANARDSHHDNLRAKILGVVNNIEHDCGWEALFDVFNNTLWRRMWIVQEIVLARNPFFWTGSVSFNFKAIADFLRVKPVIQEFLQRTKNKRYHRFAMDPGLMAVKNIARTRLELNNGKQVSLPVLFWRFHNNQCFLTQEKLYSLLIMCDPQNALGLDFIDYNCSASQSYRRFLKWYIYRYENLDILSLAIPYQTGSHYYPKSPIDGDQDKTPCWYAQIVRNADNKATNECHPLVLGTFDSTRAMDIYTAGGNETVPQTCKRQPVGQEDSIAFHGAMFECVSELFVIPLNDTGLLDSHQSFTQVVEAYLEYHPGISKRAAVGTLKRTLMADQQPIGRRLSSDFPVHRLGSLTNGSGEGGVLSQLTFEEDVPFLIGRSIVITTSGRMGLAPQRAKIGDKIVILPGGAVPYLMRPTGNAASIEQPCKYFELIGEWQV